MKWKGPSCKSRAGLFLEIHDFVRSFHFIVEKLHVGQLDGVVCIHAVDAEAFASGDEYAFTEGENVCLFCNGEIRAVSVHEVDARTV